MPAKKAWDVNLQCILITMQTFAIRLTVETDKQTIGNSEMGSGL